ncbi:hypothetical protein FIV41_03170 [Pseudomonas marginalis]|uniref:Uncharacterized protein n=1 Tax=Pseudomonas marginalis TaxID=298 RepID=A0A9X9G031_PSEMA|nr:hypothetical protein [Pseudomonas marginalis]TWR63130.1 hypothetical protein FIV41_03170 [Pseudomonas marginalis]
MNVPRYQDTVRQFIDLSGEFSAQVNGALITVKRLEMAYHEIESAVSKTDDDIEVDNVVRRGLMQKIARRDMSLVLEQTLRMEKLLAESIRLLIQNGEAAVRLISGIEDFKGYTAATAAEVNIARAELVAKLNVLKDVERDMLKSDRFKP